MCNGNELAMSFFSYPDLMDGGILDSETNSYYFPGPKKILPPGDLGGGDFAQCATVKACS